MDKDTVVNAVGSSHDIHLLKIDNREDELVTRVNSWCTHLVDKVSKCPRPSRLHPLLELPARGKREIFLRECMLL